MITIETYDDRALNERVYKVRIGLEDLQDVELREFDRLQLDWPKSEKTPLADRLLDLELLVRRIEEQRDILEKEVIDE